jgi:hypothetical protein
MKSPSLKNIVLILAAAALIGGAFFVAEYRNTKDENVVYEAPVISTSTPTLSPELQNRDSDSDGLKDWEEVLLGTDAHKADTDGDGTADGKETTLGRNPLVKGPKDKMSETASSKTPTEDLTPTDLLARDFFARYMELRQAGLSQDPQSQIEVAQQVVTKSGIILSAPKLSDASSIKVRKDDTKVSVTRYGNDVGSIFIKYPINGRNEAVIAKEAIEKENPDVLKELDPIIVTYQSILNELITTEVPASLVQTHVNLINGMKISLFVAQSFRKSGNDPVLGLQATSQYLEGARKLFDSFLSIREKIGLMGIEYQSGEGGIFFMTHQ